MTPSRTPDASSPEPKTVESNFTFVEGDPFYRIQRACGLIPGESLGAVRRIAFFICVGWLPVVILAIIDKGMPGESSVEPLLSHSGVHTRFLLVIPLCILAEWSVKSVCPAYLRHFERSGLVDKPSASRFQSIVDAAERLKNSRLAFAAIVALIGALAFWSGHVSVRNGANGLSMAGLWYVYVSEPLFELVLAVWAWRLIVMLILLFRVSRLELRLVPTHPDGAGGLGFLDEVPVSFAPFVLGISAAVASRLGHEVMYHGVKVASVTPYAAGVCLMALFVFLAPFLVFYLKLRTLKLRALMEYGALTGRHDWLVDRKWIRSEPVGDQEEPLLDSPELGPLVDVNSIYQAVEKLRFVPLGKRSILIIAAASLLPFVPVYAIQIPIRDMVTKIAGALF